MQGVDITPILKDPKNKVRDCCLVETDEADMSEFSIDSPISRMIGNMDLRLKTLITERYSLTIFNKMIGYGDLYDRKEDPHELNNLWYSNPELRHELVEKLLHEVINAQSLYPKKQGMG
jgi:hypothetical protein